MGNPNGPTDRICVNCDRRVIYARSPLGGAWIHVASRSIYCDQSGTVTARPGVLAR